MRQTQPVQPTAAADQTQADGNAPATGMERPDAGTQPAAQDKPESAPNPSGNTEQQTDAGNAPNEQQGDTAQAPDANAEKQFAGRGNFPGMQPAGTATFDIQDWIPTIAGAILLLIAIFVAVKWKRKY